MNDKLWIEAEAFADLGGWTVDAQFIDQMGSSYLLADGMCTPVADARHSLQLASGTYAIWARTCDWLPEHSPGRFHLKVNGVAGNKLGVSGLSGWHWEKAGDWTISGETMFSLCDETGEYGRIDALLLTTDSSFTPSDAKTEALRDTLRQQAEVPHTAYDIVVIGGGLGGCTAAVAAARSGARVALVNNRPVLGGNGSTQYLVPPAGAWYGGEPGSDQSVTISKINARETGILEEYRTMGHQHIREGMLYSGRLQAMVDAEPNITYLHGQHARKAITEGGRIIAAECMDIRTGLLSVLAAQMFIDCSGDSQFAVSAGAEYRQGRESYAEHQEPWAPAEANANTMGNGIKYLVMETDEEQPFKAPAWAYRFEHCDDIDPVRHPRASGAIGRNDSTDPLAAMTHQWLVELGGDRDTFSDAESIRDNLLRLVYGLWDHVKNHCPQEGERARNSLLRWVGIHAGKRENRRLLGDYILTQNDICENTSFDDAVAFGAWVVDDHYSDGFFHKGESGHHYDDFEHAAYGKEYGIPLRTMYSRNVPNLLMAGRNISATHLAMSNTRQQMTCALMGQAVGTAAALCLQYGLDPREVRVLHIGELQDILLDQGAYIPGKLHLSPENLARLACITAEGETESPTGVLLDGCPRAIGVDTHAWHPRGEAPYRLTLTWLAAVQMNMAELIFQTRSLAPESFSLTGYRQSQKVFSLASDGKKVRRETLVLDAPASVDTLVLTLAEPAPLCQIDIRLLDEPYLSIARRIQANMKRVDAPPVLPWERT